MKVNLKIVKGFYLLLVKLKKDGEIVVGKLGRLEVKKGFYLYVGSAMNNLLKRVGRHFKREKRMRWHIDYLLSSGNAELLCAFLFPCERKLECKVSELVGKRADGCIEGFGASDCKCRSHLYFFKSLDKALSTVEEIGYRYLLLCRT